MPTRWCRRSCSRCGPNPRACRLGLKTHARQAMDTIVAQHPDAAVYVTGHSLGGALATLGAMDLVIACAMQPGAGLTVAAAARAWLHAKHDHYLRQSSCTEPCGHSRLRWC